MSNNNFCNPNGLPSRNAHFRLPPLRHNFPRQPPPPPFRLNFRWHPPPPPYFLPPLPPIFQRPPAPQRQSYNYRNSAPIRIRVTSDRNQSDLNNMPSGKYHQVVVQQQQNVSVETRTPRDPRTVQKQSATTSVIQPAQQPPPPPLTLIQKLPQPQLVPYPPDPEGIAGALVPPVPTTPHTKQQGADDTEGGSTDQMEDTEEERSTNERLLYSKLGKSFANLFASNKKNRENLKTLKKDIQKLQAEKEVLRNQLSEMEKKNSFLHNKNEELLKKAEEDVNQAKKEEGVYREKFRQFPVNSSSSIVETAPGLSDKDDVSTLDKNVTGKKEQVQIPPVVNLMETVSKGKRKLAAAQVASGKKERKDAYTISTNHGESQRPMGTEKIKLVLKKKKSDTRGDAGVPEENSSTSPNAKPSKRRQRSKEW